MNDFESAFDREKQMEENIAALRERIDALAAEESRAKLHLEYEQSDVEEIDGKTLKSAFYTLIGKKDEKWEQEYREAEDAKAEYEAITAELTEARKELSRAEYALRQLRRAEKEKRQAFEANLCALKERLDRLPSDVVKELFRMEQELSGHGEQEKRILAAIEEGKKALPLAESVLEPLQEAWEHGCHDRYYARQEALDEAKERQRMLHIQLERFCAVIPGIEIRTVEMDFSHDRKEVFLKRMAGGRYHPSTPIYGIMEDIDSKTARDIRIALADLEELLEARREKQEQLRERIRKLGEEWGTV